jgi:hypothetical protein
MSGEVKDFNLEEIVIDSLEKTAKIAPEVKNYIVSLSREELSLKLSPAQIKKIAKEIIRKMGEE